jgi:hypothetical protein
VSAPVTRPRTEKSPRFDVPASRGRLWGFAGAVVLASAARCDVKGDAGPPDATTPVCADCPPDPYRVDRLDPAVCSLQTGGVDRLPIATFDNHTSSAGLLAAQSLYLYTDGTSSLLVEDFSHKVEPLGSTANAAAGFEPPVAPGSPCTPAGDGGFTPGVFHIFTPAFSTLTDGGNTKRPDIPYVGTTFLSWGGGFGFAMAKLNGRDPNTGNIVNTSDLTNLDPAAPKNVCCVNREYAAPPTTPCLASSDPNLAAICPPAGAEFSVSIAAVDVSQYEGVSFWARRGPTGQAGLGVNVGDKYTDDDLDYIARREELATGAPQPKYCSRNRECGCTNHKDCTYFPEGAGTGSGFFCGTPNSLVGSCTPGIACGGLGTSYGASGTCCGVTTCDSVYPAYPCDPFPDGGSQPPGILGDPQFYGRPCRPYAWPNGVGGSYCFDLARGDPPPAPSTEVCGDHWMTMVDLGTDWKFYKVPFTNLRQQGFGKKSEHLDLHAVSLVKFTWTEGNIDYFIDDVGFYRARN